MENWQKDIIKEAGVKVGLSEVAANRIFAQFGNAVGNLMSRVPTNDVDVPILEEIKIINLAGIGRIVPNEYKIEMLTRKRRENPEKFNKE